MKKNIYFVLYACCIPVKGATRSAIYDLQRNTYEYIPLLMHELIEECKAAPLVTVATNYSTSDWEAAKGFLAYLETEQYGFFTDSPEEFPPLPMQWYYPGKIVNSIIEYKKGTDSYNLPTVIRQLFALGCHDIQLRLFGDIDYAFVNNILSLIGNSRLCTLDLLVPYSEALDTVALFNRIKTEHRVIPLTVYSCNNLSLKDIITQEDAFFRTRINITTQKLKPNSIPENSIPTNFVINTDFFTESQQFNTGLNRKVCIDVKGNIKNHILHTTIFGNVQKDKLADIIEQPAFQKKWHVNNDRVIQCNICEHRYMCMDTSDILYKADGMHKKQKCGYNPVTGQWQQ